ncbi:substrate-binding domain-containing protein [Alkalihalobacterium alkalinitrilicum]|uniref:substrate-binding domain-containing protein n=1 Tax=Alkalihalobacterium alkalinitrilicum TaxID=427920 RepID=UPI00099509BC|nr:substrate-binding domain-containing protein [Alkalihalobacterium alkalinitrilicum]
MRSIAVYSFIISLLFITGCTFPTSDASTSQPSSDLILATTTSTQDSGLLDILVPMFEDNYNFNVKTIAVGTGQALEMGKRGEADVLFTHAPEAEDELVQSEAVYNRKRVMYNDFIIIGPITDPAGIQGETTHVAMKKIFEYGAPFVSRGDDSGTHKKEQTLWEEVNLKPTNESWYIETGQGMGSTLQVGAERDSYVLTDRATYLSHKNNFEHMVIHVEADDSLLNIYHVMQVNDKMHSFVNVEGAQRFVDFIVSSEAQEIIEEFGVDAYGQPLFFPYID